MRRPVDGEVHVHYSQIYVESDPESFGPDLQQAFGGQRAGLCGAAIPGALWLTTGLHTGSVGFTVEVHEQAPLLDPAWEDVVEVSFRPVSAHSSLMQWAGEDAWALDLEEIDYRVRYCAKGMDRARDEDTRVDGPQLDCYLVQFWPAPPEPDRVVKQTAEIAAYWHGYARTQPPPPTAAQRAETERLARLAQEQADRELRLAREKWEWGGRLPSDALRQVRGNVRGLVRFDPALVHALDAAGPDTQRAVALLAARRACEAAGLTGVDWIAAALTALAAGRVLPAPFDDRERMWETLSADPNVPRRTVGRAIAPQRPPFPTPLPPGAQRFSLGRAPLSQPIQGHVHMLQPYRAVRVAPPEPSEPGQPRPGGPARYGKLTVGPPDPSSRMSQRHMALPAVIGAAEADPLRAALDAVFAAIAAYGADYPALLDEVRSACASRDGKAATGADESRP